MLGELSLLLVRHAEIDNAQGRRFIGRTDLPLTPQGEAQATALAARLGESESCPVYASPLKRARSTALALEAAGLPPAVVLPDLREIDFGGWEGRLSEEVVREEPQAYARWREVDAGFAFPNGEAVAGAAQRMAAALRAVLDRGDPIAVVVAHGGVLRLGLCELLRLPWKAAPRFRFDFTGITRLERHADRLVLAGLNDTAHLAGVPAP